MAPRTFLLERYWPGVTPGLAAEATQRLLEAAAGSAGNQTPVRHLASALLPVDEVLFTFIEADSVTSVRALSDRAAFRADRISESVAVGPPTERDA